MRSPPTSGSRTFWALPTPGGPGELGLLIETVAVRDPGQGTRRSAKALWSLRAKLGDLLGLDGDGSGALTLRDRLPEDLLATPGPRLPSLPFNPLYVTDDEFAAELANRTMHGVMHLGWVEEKAGCYRGQMAVLVKPNGALGSAYMAAIRPFRHRIVYPAMLDRIERTWLEMRSRRMSNAE